MEERYGPLYAIDAMAAGVSVESARSWGERVGACARYRSLCQGALMAEDFLSSGGRCPSGGAYETQHPYAFRAYGAAKTEEGAVERMDARVEIAAGLIAEGDAAQLTAG